MTIKTANVLLIAAIAIVICLFPMNELEAQVCGDANGNGSRDIGDLVALVNYLYVDGMLSLSPGADCDGFQGITIRDLLFVEDNLFNPCGVSAPTFICSPLLPFSPPEVPGNCWDIPERIVGAGETHKEITLRLHHTQSLRAFEVPLRILINGVSANIDSVKALPPYAYQQFGRFRLSDTSVAILAISCDLPASYNDVARVFISFPPEPFCRGMATAYDLRSGSHLPVLIQSDFVAIKPSQGCADLCCLDLTGNADFDITDFVDISDVQAMIDWLFCGEFAPALPCPAEADLNVDSSIDLGDMQALIDYLFFNIETRNQCQ